MRTRTNRAPDSVGVDHTAVELALETLPFVTRACVARSDEQETVVLVSVDPGRFEHLEAGSPVRREAQRVLRDQGLDPTGIRVLATTGWLPGRDAFPAAVRRRCVRARYSPLLVTLLTSVLPGIATPLAIA